MEVGISPSKKDKVCVCCVVAVSFKVGLSGHKQRFLVNQSLLSCCINTITQINREFGFKIVSERILHFKCEMMENFQSILLQNFGYN